MENEVKNNESKSNKGIIILVCVIAAVALLVFGIVLGSNKAAPTKDELINLVATTSPSSSSTVTDYLKFWNFPKFSQTTLSTVEKRYGAYYFNEMPGVDVMAKKTAELFIEHFYDNIDLNDEQTVTRAIIACFIESTGDKYGFYQTKEDSAEFDTSMSGKFVGVGISVLNDTERGILIIEVYKDSPAKAAGLLPGDVIIAVDGVSSSAVPYNELVNKIRGEVGTEVTIRVRRGADEHEYKMPRAVVVQTTVESEQLDGNIGYIKISEFKLNTAEQVKAEIVRLTALGVDGIIFDVRNNPGGYVSAVVDTISLLVPSNTKVASFSDGRAPLVTSHGAGELEPTDTVLDLPVVVLTGPGTASAAEMFAAAIRDYDSVGIMKAIVVGDVTYKKGVIQSTFAVTDGDTVTISTAYYKSPLGASYDGVGVEPDVKVTDDKECLQAGIDEIKKLFDYSNVT